MPKVAPWRDSIKWCARCGGDHEDLEVFEFTKPFAPPEAAPIAWKWWAECPTTGDPILIAQVDPQ